MLVYRMPQLLVIDGIPVSDEERTKAELYFMEQQVNTQYPATKTISNLCAGQRFTYLILAVYNHYDYYKLLSQQ